ncbi:MAG TPA: lipid A export permease/ATP-binding protein MsbA [Arenimonas sp.]|uniref:lipid A export permease/ATP-binding protein MsbA n=1 Tax=Arenimonas sp. TaxID=1872635 RepID=UPI002CB939AE|nr:lipid A export permease/ATP-binding protein MsbA [Arenimonas sp.]HMB57314.1 lipid A export permease/ATP-binding protein MsbA [Arenimonas sp.]
MNDKPETTSYLRAYQRLLLFAKPFWGLLALAALGMTLEAMAGGYFINLMKPIVDKTFVEKGATGLATLPLVILGLFLVRGIATFTSDYCMARTGNGLVRNLQLVLFDKFLHLPSARYDAESVPALLARLGYDTGQVAGAVTEALKILITDSLTIVVMTVTMFVCSWKVTVAMLLVAPGIALISSYVSKRYRRINQGIQQTVARVGQATLETLSAHQEVKIYGAQASELERFAMLSKSNVNLAMKIETTRGAASSVVQLLGAAALALILFMAGIEATAGRMTAGDFVVIMTAMMAVLPSLKRITNVQSPLQRGLHSADRLFRMLDEPGESDLGQTALPRARGDVEFRNVSLRYDGQSASAIDKISFTARPGTVTAIVGRSGGGKSTLIRLLPRFYEPTSGEVLLDGRPLTDYKLSDLRSQIGLVGQRVMLFDDTVAANIAYGQEGIDHAAIRRAADAANASEFIDRLPQGLDTRIGENGGLLSGGQRQRIAIARAILKDAPILILDEATAALDNESERLVQDALDRLIPDRTTLVIAHRLSTIEHADQVLVLDQGRLVEQGTHAQLLAQGGLYSYLHRMQFRETETE